MPVSKGEICKCSDTNLAIKNNENLLRRSVSRNNVDSNAEHSSRPALHNVVSNVSLPFIRAYQPSLLDLEKLRRSQQNIPEVNSNKSTLSSYSNRFNYNLAPVLPRNPISIPALPPSQTQTKLTQSAIQQQQLNILDQLQKLMSVNQNKFQDANFFLQASPKLPLNTPIPNYNYSNLFPFSPFFPFQSFFPQNNGPVLMPPHGFLETPYSIGNEGCIADFGTFRILGVQ
jgi:hypothetical protein